MHEQQGCKAHAAGGVQSELHTLGILRVQYS